MTQQSLNKDDSIMQTHITDLAQRDKQKHAFRG